MIRDTFKCCIAFGACFLVFGIAVAGNSITVPSGQIQTIAHAFIRAKPGDTVWVNNGIYRERVFVESGITLMARHPLKAVIDGKGKGTVVTLGRNASISGFVIKNGTIGIFSKHPGNTIKNCRIENNFQTGIICVRHLPMIEDNVIAFNRGSGIQGWDVRSAGPTVNHNTIAFNENNGIAMGGKSNILIQHNIISFNERLGTKIRPEAEKVKIANNNIYGNLWSPKPQPEGNFSYNPQFSAPRSRMDFKVSGKVVCPECPKDEIPGVRMDSQSTSTNSDLF
ncbi:MAG: hypothetical protein GF401_06810 [Chitinivibrionales bacterium]|nr:hypothetical protein [Chitinivibrionales bacterium]